MISCIKSKYFYVNNFVIYKFAKYTNIINLFDFELLTLGVFVETATLGFYSIVS